MYSWMVTLSGMIDCISVYRFKEKKISLVEFKAVAKLATHELYKGSAEVGSRLWHESEKYIVRKVLKDLRAVRHAS